jgi:hypothetical protein
MTGSRDPTRSLSLRREGRGKVTRKVFELHRGMRQAVVDSDIAGLRGREPTMSRINWGEAAEHRLSRSDAVMQATVDTALLNPPDWLGGLIERAILKGVEQASQELRTELAIDLGDVNAVHTFAVMSEVTGIANETIRRALRLIGDAVERKTSPEILMRDLRIVLEKVTKLRLNMLVNTAVVRAVNAGKLVAYKDQGVKQVGVNPEWMPVPHVHDAKKIKAGDIEVYEWESETAFLLRCMEEVGNESQCQLVWDLEAADRAAARKKAATRKTAAKKKAAKKKSKSKKGLFSPPVLVNVLTSGDDRVCDDCNDIAAEGPYDIDTAQGLIPSHPNCRCAFVPFDDSRYAPIEEQDEEW